MSLSDIQSNSRFGLHEAVSLCSQVDHHLLLLARMASLRGDTLGDLLRKGGATDPQVLLVSTAEIHGFTCGLFSQDS